MPGQIGWIYGSVKDSHDALVGIKKQFVGQDIVHYNSEISYAYLENQINSSSCFCEKRLIVIDDLPESKSKSSMVTKFKKLLDDLPDDLLLIFHGISPDDEASLFNHVKNKKGKLFISPVVLKADEAPGWVISEAESLGKQLSRDGADLLIKLVGFDGDLNGGKGGLGVDRLRISVEKLCLYIGSRRRNITIEDIEITSFLSEENLRFNSMFEALDSRDIERCYKTFKQMLLESNNLKEASERLFSTSLWRYRLLSFLKEGLVSKSRGEVLKDALSMNRLTQTGSGFGMRMKCDAGENGLPKAWPEFAINQALGIGFNAGASILESYGRKDMIRILTALQDGQIETRIRDSEESLWIVVDAFFLAVCTQTADKHLSIIRKTYEF